MQPISPPPPAAPTARILRVDVERRVALPPSASEGAKTQPPRVRVGVIIDTYA